MPSRQANFGSDCDTGTTKWCKSLAWKGLRGIDYPVPCPSLHPTGGVGRRPKGD